MKGFLTCVSILASVLVGSRGASGQQIPMKSCQLSIVDAKGAPIEGAQLRLESVNGNYLIPIGPLASFGTPQLSDPSGKLVARYPGLPFLLTEDAYLGGTIHHPDFVSREVQFGLGESQAKERIITMQPGVEVVFTILDDLDEKIKQPCGICFANSGPPLIRRPQFDRLVTRALQPGIWQAMIVQPMADGRSRFSEPMVFRAKSGQSPQEFEAWMEPGISVKGRLSPNVPRPIRNGYVTAFMQLGKSDDLIQPVEWHDYVSIQEDGGFQFDSMPREGKLQLIAQCEGWVATEMVKGKMVQGRIVDANGEKMELELDMSSTFTARFRCEDPAGKPVKGVNISVYANQQYLNGGNTLLGARHRSIESIQSQIEGKLISGEVKDWTFFSGASGEDGVLEIKGLPRTRSNFSANIVPPMHTTPFIESFPAPSVEQSISEQTIRIVP